MTRPSRATALALIAALVAAGCSLPGSSTTRGRTSATPSPGAAAPVRWRACPEVAEEVAGSFARRAEVTYECATIQVPRDWGQVPAGASPGAGPGVSPTGGPGGGTRPEAGSSGGTFDIALLRARARDQRDRIGSLLVNPGGPGGSGMQLAVYLSLGEQLGGLPAEVTRRFDLVGFDPRGVGRSSPVKCISDADLDASFGYAPDPVDQAAFDTLVTLTKRIADECGRKYGDTLRLFSTEQAARDMDAIRAAVGDQKTSYLGYSYGTLLGATYAQLHPDRVRALVLDGAVDPRADSVAASEAQAKGFELAFGNFATWCAANASSCPIAPDAKGAVRTALAKAAASPVRGKDGRQATTGWVFYAVVSSLYTESSWQKLAQAVGRLQAGTPDEMFALADAYTERRPDGTYSNLFDANAAVNCADEDDSPTVAEIRALQGQWRARYPMFGAPLALGLLTCAQWPGGRDPFPAGQADGAPPIVVVGTTGDPATPYEQTPRLADMLGVGVVLTWQGEGHTAYPETTCVNSAVNRYLIELAVPRQGLTCPAR